MKIRNTSPKGKWLHVKKNGYTEKVWLAGYSTIDLPYVTSRNDLNLNAHEEAIIHAEKALGHEVDNIQDIFKYSVNVIAMGSGGTSSLSASTVSINEGMNLSFEIYQKDYNYISAYTINSVSYLSSIGNTSARTISSTITNIQEDKEVRIGFAVWGY